MAFRHQERDSSVALLAHATVRRDSSGSVYVADLNATGLVAGARALIDGVADAIQFTVQGHSTQTNFLMVLEKSDGTDVFTVSNVGDTNIYGAVVIDPINAFSIPLVVVGNGGVDIFQAKVGAAVATSIQGDGNVFIDGLADVVQLTVQGHSTQTNHLLLIEDSAGNDLYTFGLTTLTLGAGVSITFPDNVRQTFNPGATVAGINVGSLAGDPSTPIDGDLWLDSSGTPALKARVNGTTVAPIMGVRIDSSGSVVSQPRLNLIAGTNTSLSIADDGTEIDVTINSTGGGGGGAPSTAKYVIIGPDDAGLSAERFLAVGAALSLTDSGANANVTIGTVAFTGDVTTSANSFATTIAANAVSDGKLRQSSGLSVIGKSTTGTGNVADITASSDNTVLRRSGGSLGFGTIIGSNITANAVGDTQLRDSGACSVIGRSANSSGDPADISAGSNNTVLQRVGNALSFATVPAAAIAAMTSAELAAIISDETGSGVLVFGTSPTFTTSLTLNGNSVVDGNADSIQLRVQGHSTQTSSLMVLEKSDGTDVFTVSNVGDTAISGGVTIDPTSAFSVPLTLIGAPGGPNIATNFSGATEVGGVTADGGYYVIGTVDAIHLSLKANATQTNPILSIVDSADALLYSFGLTTLALGTGVSITFPDNVRQTFNPGATVAGMNVGSIAGDPSTPINGDLWYDSTANELTARINGSNVALGSGGGGGAPTTASYVVISLDGTLSAERTLAVGSALSLSDGGANANVTIGTVAFTGDVTTAANSFATTIANNAVTYAKLQDVTDARLLGRSAGSPGDAQEITVASPLTLSGGVLDFDETALLASNARVALEVDNVLKGTRRTLNLLNAGKGVAVTAADDSGNEEVDVTVTGYIPEYSATQNGIYPAQTAANNTTNLQTLITTVIAAGGGIIVFDTPGTHNFNRSGSDNPYSSGHGYVADIAGDTVVFRGLGRVATVLKLAASQQVDRTTTGTGPIDFFVFKDRRGIGFLDLTIDGNAANQSGWTGGYSQVTNGCLIYGYSVLTGSAYSQDFIARNLTLTSAFSNPINIEGVNGFHWENLDTYNCGEGPQVANCYAGFFDNISYTDNTAAGVTVGDGFEISKSSGMVVGSITVNGVAGWTAGTAIDLFLSSFITVASLNANMVPGGIDTSPVSTLYTDLVVDGTDNKKVTSSARGAFGTADYNKTVYIPPSTANGTPGFYRIVQTASGAAIFDRSPGATGTTGITFATDNSYSVVVNAANIEASRNAIITLGDGITTWNNIIATNAQTDTGYAIQVASTVTRGNYRISNSKFQKCGQGIIQGTCYASLFNCDFTYSRTGPGLSITYAAGRQPTVFLQGGEYSNNATYPILIDGQGNSYRPKGLIAPAIAENNGTSDNISAVNSGSMGLMTILPPRFRIANGTDMATSGDSTTLSSSTYFFTDSVKNFHILITAGTGWTQDLYQITATGSNLATVHKSVGTHPLTGGTWALYAAPPILDGRGMFIDTNNINAITQKATSSNVIGLIGVDSSNRIRLGWGLSTPVLADGTFTVSGVSTFNNNVSITGSSTFTVGGVSTFNANVVIDGSADAIQLRIQGNATQTNPLLTLENSGGTDVLTVSNTGLLTFATGVTQVFAPDATNAGINVGSVAGDPSSADNGDIWYDSTANELTARINGANVALGAGGGGGAPTDATYITQTANGSLSAEQALSSLATGLVQVTTTTGVLSSVTTSAGIAALISDETGSGALVFGTAPTFTTSITMADAANVILNTTTGTKIGTSSTQKLAFFNATPIVQQANTADIKDVIASFGFMVNGGASPLNLDGGALTAGATVVTTFNATGAGDFDLTLNVDGATTLNAAAVIDGSADAIQLRVQGHSTQTSSLLVLEKSDGTDVLTVSNTGLVSFAAGVTQVFSPDATNAGINVGSVAGDPSSADNGDIWYDSTANELTARINGSNVALGAGGGGGAPTTATYITQTPDAGLSAEQALSSLSTGLMQVTTTTGVISSVTTSAGVAALISDETGSGALVFGTTPSLTTPNITGQTEILGNADEIQLVIRAHSTQTSSVFRTETSGGGTTLTISGTGVLTTGGSASDQSTIARGIILNNLAGSATADDVQVKGASDDNLLYVDASTNRVGIGTATPAHKLDVNGVVNATSGNIFSDGHRVGYNLSVYATGTAYSLTNSAALLNFGTIDPQLTIDKPGTYLIACRVSLKYNAATFAANQTVTLKIRRTNNTAADLTSSTITATTRIITTITDTMADLTWLVVYTTTNSNDAIELQGMVGTTPSAGSLDVVEASMNAVRLY